MVVFFFFPPNCVSKNTSFVISNESQLGHFRLRSLLLKFPHLIKYQQVWAPYLLFMKLAGVLVEGWLSDASFFLLFLLSIFFGGRGRSKTIADGDCSHEIKRCFLLGRKAMTNLDNILKSRDISLSTKIHLVKAMFFPVVMYGCESWAIKIAEC